MPKQYSKQQIQIMQQLELDEHYGERRMSVGAAFMFEDEVLTHYYLQRKNDVVHVCPEGGILNTLHRGFFNEKRGMMTEITEAEFRSQVKKLLYEKELDEFWGDGKGK